MDKWLFLAGAIISEVTATLSLKGALHHTWLYALVVVGYLAAFTCLDMALRRGMMLGTAYGIWGALGVASTAAFSSMIFHERLTVLSGVGIMLIIGGVLIVETGSQKANAEKIIEAEEEILEVLEEEEII